ncbi:MAG: DNA-directed RNA polymerase subunit alpha C-terminal domain-containing protein [Phycisphaerales bacterium]
MSEDAMEMLIGASGETVTRDEEASRSQFLTAENAERLGDREGAVNAYRKALQFDPENVEAAFRLAYNLDLVGEEDEALALYERCVDHSPPHINALMNLSVCYEDRGYYRKAEKCLRQVLDTSPNHPRAREYMKDVIASFDMEIDEEHERILVKRNALLDTPVTDFELSVRARNCLKKMNIRTLGDLLRTTEAELLGYKNFGETSLQEIKEMLSSKGLRLGQGLDEQHDMVRREVYESLKGSPQEHLLQKPVSDLDLSVRARKALQTLGCQSIADLCARTEAELLGVKNFGSTSLVEIKEKLNELGLGLRELRAT